MFLFRTVHTFTACAAEAAGSDHLNQSVGIRRCLLLDTKFSFVALRLARSPRCKRCKECSNSQTQTLKAKREAFHCEEHRRIDVLNFVVTLTAHRQWHSSRLSKQRRQRQKWPRVRDRVNVPFRFPFTSLTARCC